MAFTAVAALAAGEAATATLVLAAVAEVGTALTVVGAITGSKDLMKIGAVMGMVGGIGGAIAGGASAAGAEAATGALSDEATNAALDSASQEALSSYGGDAAMQASQQAGIQSMEQGASQGLVGSQVAAPVADVAPVAQQAVTATPIQPGEVSAPAQQTVNDVVGAQAPNGVAAPVGAQGPADLVTPYTNPTDMRLANGKQTTPGGAMAPSGPASTSDSLFARFSDWANKNKEVANAGLQTVGGLFKGANDRSMFNEKIALQRDMWNRANNVGSFAPSLLPQTGLIGKAAA
jgi:hypothetical protein